MKDLPTLMTSLLVATFVLGGSMTAQQTPARAARPADEPARDAPTPGSDGSMAIENGEAPPMKKGDIIEDGLPDFEVRFVAPTK